MILYSSSPWWPEFFRACATARRRRRRHLVARGRASMRRWSNAATTALDKSSVVADAECQ